MMWPERLRRSRQRWQPGSRRLTNTVDTTDQRMIGTITPVEAEVQPVHRDGDRHLGSMTRTWLGTIAPVEARCSRCSRR